VEQVVEALGLNGTAARSIVQGTPKGTVSGCGEQGT